MKAASALRPLVVFSATLGLAVFVDPAQAVDSSLGYSRSSGSGASDLSSATAALMGTLATAGVSIRNVLYGLAALAVVVCGGAAFLGRFPSQRLWTIVGGVVTIAVAGLCVDLLIKDSATGSNPMVYAVELE